MAFDKAAAEIKLSEYDFVLVGDASGSMGETDMPGKRSRWDSMQESMMSFARDVGKIDSDGVGLVLFGGSNVNVKDGCDADAIKAQFDARAPRGGTPLAEALKEAFKLAGKSAKKDMIIVFTDGVPDDPLAVASLIRDQSNKQTADDELTILFIQVGYNAEATRYLQGLDDNLKGAKFDIVDVKTMAEAEAFASTAELIMAAIDG
jgi:Mg-chelatase subunit ChlD